MRLLFTLQALESLQECLDFFPPDVSEEKRTEIRDWIISKTELLLKTHPPQDSERNT